MEVPVEVGGEPLEEAEAGGACGAVAPGGGDFGELAAGEKSFDGDFEGEREASLAFESERVKHGSVVEFEGVSGVVNRQSAEIVEREAGATGEGAF